MILVKIFRMEGEKMLETIYKALLNKVNLGSKCAVLTYLDFKDERQGFITEKLLITEEEIKNRSLPISEDIYHNACISLDNGRLGLFNIDQSKAVLIEPFIPKPRLILFGGGHIAKPLSELAVRVGFSVTVIDDRLSFANTGRFPEAAHVICENFQKCFDLIHLSASDFVVIITRGHKHDGVVLREVLKHDLCYIGMIGSKRRIAGMREELLNEGFAKTKLDLVNAPIGLDISAITPDEIAISILSQLILYKNKGIIDKFGKDFTYPEFDIEVAERISEESLLPKAIITILSSKGSVPRKAGAKMLVYYDGRTVGSVGGGCSEAALLVHARDIMLHKGFSIEHVDMTGDVAEAEGMVCGGVMEVLIEVL
jgi:xanthine dehydrogenase accessory factor